MLLKVINRNVIVNKHFIYLKCKSLYIDYFQSGLYIKKKKKKYTKVMLFLYFIRVRAMPRKSNRLQGRKHPYAPTPVQIEGDTEQGPPPVHISTAVQTQSPGEGVQGDILDLQPPAPARTMPTPPFGQTLPGSAPTSTSLHSFQQDYANALRGMEGQLAQDVDGGMQPDLLGIDFGVGAHPSPLLSVCSQLGGNVHTAIKDKIWKGEYVDLGLLLVTDPENFSHQSLVVKNGSIQLKNNFRPKIESIAEWTDAMLIFSSIFLVKSPERVQELLKYINNVRSAYTSFGGYGWRNYDIQFRLRQARDPTRSWGAIDAELWLICLGGHSSSVHQNKGTQNRSQGSQKICYAYQQGSCQRRLCGFSHSCITCGGSHPAMNCIKSGQTGPVGIRGAGNSNFSRPQNPSSFRPSNQYSFRARNPQQVRAGSQNRPSRPTNQ